MAAVTVKDKVTRKVERLRYHEIGPWLDEIRLATLSNEPMRGDQPRCMSKLEVTKRIRKQVAELRRVGGHDEFEDAPSYSVVLRVLGGANWYGGYMMRILQIARALDVEVGLSKGSKAARIV